MKVGDQGMAVSLATLPQIIGGTQGYSAPEQWRDGHRATSRLCIQESEGGRGQVALRSNEIPFHQLLSRCFCVPAYFLHFHYSGGLPAGRPYFKNARVDAGQRQPEDSHQGVSKLYGSYDASR